jgi:thymidine kinase
MMLSELVDTWRDFEVIGIDEGQFFGDIVEFSSTAANEGKIIIMSALDGMYTQKGFPKIMELIPMSEKVTKLSAICKICSHNAHYTFRTVNDNEKEVLIGGAEAYMPLCRECLVFMNS